MLSLTLINIIVLVIFIVILHHDGSVNIYLLPKRVFTALVSALYLACYYILSMEHIRML